ncbi:hypothetical protein CC78DRAFT_539262 [Lojkania enalia]|uniref:Cupredoxin n=1 Tax=Lojkania enalia TaxID=147567 RepID=A0A9P4NBH5_9PLEO|nr:hypothetical protein CC78DRAFT_539262 [Didymosphaeria enalia]
MHFSTLFAATALAGFAIAEDHIVSVGTKGTSQNIFTPNVTTAKNGDRVIFKFWPKAHSVVQAAFNSPCTPMDGGFWSGFVPTTDTETAAPTTFTVEITNETQPLWFYCSQGMHCQSGMVGVINPPNSETNTIEAFAEAASSASENESPEEEAPLVGTLSNSTTTMTPTASGAANTGSPTGAASALDVNKNLALSGALVKGFVGGDEMIQIIDFEATIETRALL